MPGIELIVGLGNPEPKYLLTRHNAGFRFIDQLAEQLGWRLRAESKFKGQSADGVISSQKIRLLKPLTYMNLSGHSVALLANFYKIPVDNVLVVYDDMDFDVGVVRLRQGGSAGRHNGVQSVIDCLGHKKFWRLRIGIGHPGERAKVLGYVLGQPILADATSIARATAEAMDCFDLLTAGDFQQAMNRLHVKPQK